MTIPCPFTSVAGVIETRGHSGKRRHRLGPAALARSVPWALACWLLLAGQPADASPLVSTDSPIGFFTNVASRLLQSQLGLSVNHIQVYPTNQYTPSVHRLLQVTANLYDALTNRPATAYPYLPSVFRPVFAKQADGAGVEVFISGYREVTAADTDGLVNQWNAVRDLSDPSDLAQFDPANDMVYGIPLVIGAKKGYPNFNEFAMQTQVQVARKLQFHRPGTSTTQPVNEIDQMFVVGISNVFGVEAWNSYSAAFPRNLTLVVWPDISVLVTNLETGKWLNAPPLLSRYRRTTPVTTNILANAWPGYESWQEWSSFQIPLLTNWVFLTNSTYAHTLDQFMPLTGNFERTPGSTNFYVPRWQLSLIARLRFALVDTDANRIVDYVNPGSTAYPLDTSAALMTGGVCGQPYVPNGSNGSMWCTNRFNGGTTPNVCTLGILNQIEASLGHISPNWNSSIIQFPPGMDKTAAISFFKGQFIPGYPKSSNTFNAPFQPLRDIYLVTSWQANDPLVHYTTSDLTDLVQTNLVLDQFTWGSPVENLGRVNDRYEPWGRYRSSSLFPFAGLYDITVKDRVATIERPEGRSDDWDFPTSQTPDASWLGRVHRGTPWQTLYLKAPAASLLTWKYWTGDNQLLTNWNGFYGPTLDAFFSHPTNDWRLASPLVSLFSTNASRDLHSVNQPSVAAWCGVLDGIIVLTNTPDGQLNPLVMQSNSPQALIIATALSAMQSNQPGHVFLNVGDIIATPELSTNSPWLNLNDAGTGISAITDAAYEAIPAQLLARLRPDSVASVRQTGGCAQIQFSGLDGLAYAVQTSSNLADWTAVSTNYAINGSFIFSDTLIPGTPGRYFRSCLLP